MANPPVAAVKPNTITDVEPLHGQGQISAWHLQQQMIVVAHQHPTVKQQPASFHHLPQQRSEVQTVGIVPEDVLALVAARDTKRSAAEFAKRVPCSSSNLYSATQSTLKCRMQRYDPRACFLSCRPASAHPAGP